VPAPCALLQLATPGKDTVGEALRISEFGKTGRQICLPSEWRKFSVLQGKVKQIVGGSLSDLSGTTSTATENYVSEHPASYYARLYERDKLEGGHVIMLGGDPGSKEAALDALAAWPGHLQVGGGVNTDNARQWLDAGASALIVTSFVFAGGRLQQDRLNALVRLVGRQRLVLDLSCRMQPDNKCAFCGSPLPTGALQACRQGPLQAT
jgi:phosphoribosylformimino-5-aminoimidazole carboxamide ribotide isomerase